MELGSPTRRRSKPHRRRTINSMTGRASPRPWRRSNMSTKETLLERHAMVFHECGHAEQQDLGFEAKSETKFTQRFLHRIFVMMCKNPCTECCKARRRAVYAGMRQMVDDAEAFDCLGVAAISGVLTEVEDLITEFRNT